MLRPVDLEHLRTFARVVRLGSLTKAALSLGLPKSTVSRRLAELERQLETQLVQRTTRRLAVTEAGYRLFEHAEHHILELEAVARTIADHSGELRGTLRVTTPAGMTSVSMVPLVQSFLDLHPQVKIVILATNRRVDLVAEGVDLAVRAGPLPASSLIARKLSASEFRLYASEAYLARRGTPKRVSDLLQHECLVFSEDQPHQKWQLRSVNPPHKRQELRVTGHFAVTDFAAVTRACVAGMGIALLPNQGVHAESPTSELRRVLPQWRGPDAVLHAVYPAANQISPTLRAFVDHITAHSALLFAPTVSA
jgi:DNA-binding transcriptional LysR family regulator